MPAATTTGRLLGFWLGSRNASNGLVRLFYCQPASYWLPVAFYTPIGLALILWNVLVGGVAWWQFAVLPLAGVMLWTLLEYFIHSIGFHRPTRSMRLQVVQGSHSGHHADPTELTQIVSRLSFTLPVALVIFAVLSLVLWSVQRAGLAMVGVIVGYLAYEVIHYRIHVGRRSRWLPRSLVRNHLYHHHKDQTRCFGVTTTLWDHVFRTQRPTRRRRTPSTPTPAV
jgi:sterol desaturase/sphingolipid hydroxylase (fatty acid hydroxylase superfamily)